MSFYPIYWYRKIRDYYTDNDKTLYWSLLFLSISVKLFYFFVGTFSIAPSGLPLFTLNGDQVEYVTLAENLYKHGIHAYVNGTSIYKHAVRMPGLAVIYLPLRFFFSKVITINLILIFQTILSGLASVYVFKIGKITLQSQSGAFVMFLLYTFSLFAAGFNGFFLTESLAGSCMVFSIYLLFKRSYIASSIFWSWTIFLRPYLLIIWMLGIAYIALADKNNQMLKKLGKLVIPVVLVLSAWTVRNFYYLERFVPLQTSMDYLKANKSKQATADFIKLMGYDWGWWKPNQHGWFLAEEHANSFGFSHPNDSIFGNEIVTEHFNIDSLNKVRNHLLLANNYANPNRQLNDSIASSLLNNFMTTYKKNHWCKAHIQNRVVLLFNFLNHKYGHPVLSFKYPLNLVLRSLDLVFNYFIIITGILGILFGATKKDLRCNLKVVLLSSVPLFIITLFPIYMKIAESRFLYLGYLFLIPFSTIITQRTLSKRIWIVIFSIATIASLIYHFYYFR